MSIKRRLIGLFVLTIMMQAQVFAQTALKKVYDESIEPLGQIESTVQKASNSGKYVICQVGGNWCPWCLKFADFITRDNEIDSLIHANFEYIHVNYNPRQQTSPELMKRLNNCGRFGYPVFVVLDTTGKPIHIQDSSFLEEGEGYSREKVLRFFKAWTPKAVAGNNK